MSSIDKNMISRLYNNLPSLMIFHFSAFTTLTRVCSKAIYLALISLSEGSKPFLISFFILWTKNFLTSLFVVLCIASKKLFV